MKHRTWIRRVDGIKQRYIIGRSSHNSFHVRPVLTPKKQKELVRQYQHKSIANVKMTPKRITGRYDGKRLSYPYTTVKHMNTIGNWRHKINDSTLKIDSDIKPRNIKPLLVHEAVEVYLVKKKDMPVGKAHILATKAEEKFVKGQKKNWRNYQISVMKTPR